MNAPVVQQAGPSPLQARDGGAGPTLALHSINVAPIPFAVAKRIITRYHYLHSFPGGTRLTFGMFAFDRLVGALALGVGSANAHRLIEGAAPDDCLTLSRFWLHDSMPPNSESRVIGIVLRALRRYSTYEFVVSYADPAQQHIGTIYQATGWLYTGLSDATPLYAFPGYRPRHSRTISGIYGTRSSSHFQSLGVNVVTVLPEAKHRYIYCLAPSVRDRLTVPILPYPKER